MPDTQALEESEVRLDESFEQWLERVEEEQKGR